MTNSRSGQRWSGNWSYTQTRTNLEINLHSGPIGSLRLTTCQPVNVLKQTYVAEKKN